MPHLIVTPLSRLQEIAEAHRASRIVTLINSATRVERPVHVAQQDHLFLGFNDIIEPQDGMILPGEQHVRDLFAFADRWDRQRPMIIHCYAGVSRSTAGAYMTSLYLNPDQDETELALELRRRAPTATPNAKLIAIADDILGRKGRMVDAIRSIGRGTECFEGVPFILPVSG